MSNPNIIGLYFGVGAGFLFFIYGWLICKQIPKLNQVAVVILAWTGAVVGVHLGFIALTADDPDLGMLKDQRIAVLLGALAVVWTAGESFFGSVNEVRLTSQASGTPETGAPS